MLALSIKVNGSESLKSVLSFVYEHCKVINVMKCYITYIFPVKRVLHAQVICMYYSIKKAVTKS
jgi:hypothetical protein